MWWLFVLLFLVLRLFSYLCSPLVFDWLRVGLVVVGVCGAHPWLLVCCFFTRVSGSLFGLFQFLNLLCPSRLKFTCVCAHEFPVGVKFPLYRGFMFCRFR